MFARAATPTLVARAEELAVLRAAVERASSGDAATVIVSGDAGVGKSRLVEELMRTTRDDAALVLLAAASMSGTASSHTRRSLVPCAGPSSRRPVSAEGRRETGAARVSQLVQRSSDGLGAARRLPSGDRSSAVEGHRRGCVSGKQYCGRERLALLGSA
jgi:hypothetical protein